MFKRFFAMSHYMLKCIKEEKAWWKFIGMYEGDNLATLKIGNDTLVLHPSEKVSLPIVELRSGETVVLNHWNDQLHGWDKCLLAQKGPEGNYQVSRLNGFVTEIGTILENYLV